MRHSDVAWVKPGNAHLTLHFLGETATEEQKVLVEHLKKVTFPKPFALELNGVTAFPNKKQPKILFVETTSHPSLIGLRKRIADVLAGQGFDIDARKWTPHVTIGRVKRQSEVLQPERISFEPINFRVTEFDLMSSELHAEGSLYAVEETFSLSEL